MTPEADEEESDAEEDAARARAAPDEDAVDALSEEDKPDAEVDDVLAGSAAKLEI